VDNGLEEQGAAVYVAGEAGHVGVMSTVIVNVLGPAETVSGVAVTFAS
jgi:hypothetical protein